MHMDHMQTARYTDELELPMLFQDCNIVLQFQNSAEHHNRPCWSGVRLVYWMRRAVDLHKERKKKGDWLQLGDGTDVSFQVETWLSAL